MSNEIIRRRIEDFKSTGDYLSAVKYLAEVSAMFEDDPEFDAIATEILNGARGKRASEAEATGHTTGLVETIKTPVKSITEIIGHSFRNFKNNYSNYNYSQFSNFDPSYSGYNSYNYNYNTNGYNYNAYGDAAGGTEVPEGTFQSSTPDGAVQSSTPDGTFQSYSLEASSLTEAPNLNEPLYSEKTDTPSSVEHQDTTEQTQDQ
jgi:hypothetical protein